MTVYFDLDGTLYDLYSIKNWLSKIVKETKGVFANGRKMPFDFKSLNKICSDSDIEFSVITWLPKGCTQKYAEVCRKEKERWVRENVSFVKEGYILPYGTNKSSVANVDCVLIDDDENVCKEFISSGRFAIKVSDKYNALQAVRDVLKGCYV